LESISAYDIHRKIEVQYKFGSLLSGLRFGEFCGLNSQFTRMNNLHSIDFPACPLPDLSQAAYIAPSADVIGWVELGVGVNIWHGAIIRADITQISIGAHTNVQDGAVLHGGSRKPTIIEECVTIGHRAVVHSAYIERGCLIGIGAIVLDGVRVGAGSMIAAGSVVTKDVPPRSLVMGTPARVMKSVSEAKAEELIAHAYRYEKLALVYAGKGTDFGFEQFQSDSHELRDTEITLIA
jgi:carbonic anhydrase/acetyltransferase-like protein (isoleucine patch superfamily)